jgi:peptidoglycan/xylan/chitin deacetylase (PgdA/CDA1 family)
MQPPLTIVMYHYVRPILGSHYPRIRGLELKDFEGQLDYIQRHYKAVSVKEVIDAAQGKRILPSLPILLTFDDGYLDHYEHVFPALLKRSMSGVFFPPACAVRDHKVLDVNKIHFILERAEELTEVIKVLDAQVTEIGTKTVTDYQTEFRTPSRYDTADTMYVKRMLQFALPLNERTKIVDELFQKFVSKSEASFAKGLYLSEEHLREMIGSGMTVGGHGHSHSWLNRLSRNQQHFEIENSFKWLQTLGACDAYFVFCYPYGGYDDNILALLHERNCAAGFTTKVGLSKVDPNMMLELSRIDTNDLPRDGTSPISDWTKAASSIEI